MVGRQVGPFRIERLIAVGGMAEVYLAKMGGVSGFEKRFALKVIRPHFSEDQHFIQMLVEEAKIAVQLNHSSIAQVFDLGCVDGTFYITMEYVDGPDLFRVLRRAGQRDLDIPIELAVYVAAQVCAGLDYAHRKSDAQGKPLRLVHRDVSPQNVLVSLSGEVKIIDFGIAKAALRADKTRAGVIKGKYYYMSPEQAWGDEVDHRTDIFSTGVLLYEMLAGGMLYGQEDVEQLIGLVRRADIPSVRDRRPDCPAELEKIVMKALARDRNHRYPSARYFETALTKFLAAYAPDFGSSRLAQLIRELGFDDTAAEPEITDAPVTGVTKAELVVLRAHSVIAGGIGSAPRSVTDEEPTSPVISKGVLTSKPAPANAAQLPRIDVASLPESTVVSGPPDFVALVRGSLAAAPVSSVSTTSQMDSSAESPEEHDDLVDAFGRTYSPDAAPLPGLSAATGGDVRPSPMTLPSSEGSQDPRNPALEETLATDDLAKTIAQPTMASLSKYLAETALPAGRTALADTGAGNATPPPRHTPGPAALPGSRKRRTSAQMLTGSESKAAGRSTARNPVPPLPGIPRNIPGVEEGDWALQRWQSVQAQQRTRSMVTAGVVGLFVFVLVLWLALG